MARNQIADKSVRRTGNIMRTILIWVGVALAALGGLILFVSQGNERVVLGLLVLVAIVYGFVLHDFDIDDDD